MCVTYFVHEARHRHHTDLDTCTGRLFRRQRAAARRWPKWRRLGRKRRDGWGRRSGQRRRDLHGHVDALRAALRFGVPQYTGVRARRLPRYLFVIRRYGLRKRSGLHVGRRAVRAGVGGLRALQHQSDVLHGSERMYLLRGWRLYRPGTSLRRAHARRMRPSARLHVGMNGIREKMVASPHRQSPPRALWTLLPPVLGSMALSVLMLRVAARTGDADLTAAFAATRPTWT